MRFLRFYRIKDFLKNLDRETREYLFYFLSQVEENEKEFGVS